MSACEGIPGHYLSLECVCWEVPTCASPEPVEEGSRNMGPGEVLEGAYAAGITMDRFTQMEEYVVEPGTAAEEDAQVGASTTEQICTLLGAQPFHLLNGKLTCMIFCVCITHPKDQTISCHIYY